MRDTDPQGGREEGMAKGASKNTATAPKREPRARTRLTAVDAGICVLLVLTVAGITAQAIVLTDYAFLVMIAATALSLLVGFGRLRLWAAILGVAAVTAAGAAGAYFLADPGS